MKLQESRRSASETGSVNSTMNKAGGGVTPMAPDEERCLPSQMRQRARY